MIRSSPSSLPALLLVALLLITAGCTLPGQQKTTLNVVVAGSMIDPCTTVAAEYMASHPDIDVQVEGHGSIQAIRQVTDLHRPFDLVVVADADLIPDLMGGVSPSATTYTTFATNEMVLAFTNQSMYADLVTAENWPTLLSRPDVRIGISDPKLDASGYRALMLMMLSEGYYKDAGLFDTLAGDHFEPPVHQLRDGTKSRITLAPVLKTDGRLVVRDSSLFLLSLLEAGGIDYAFEYQSVAATHHLSWIALPAAINLGGLDTPDQYSTVSVDPGVQRFSVIRAERTGTPIVYAVTVPSTAPHPAAAASFAAALINATGEERQNWPAPLSPVEHTL